MTPAEALRRFEQRLISARTIAASGKAWETYEAKVLPLPGGARVDTEEANWRASVHQGFEAGYDAAMDAVRGILMTVQSDVLREPKESE